MTSHTVYVLQENGHNGDHSWTSIDTISFDLEKLEALRATRYSEQAAKKALGKLIAQAKKDYESSNPSPSWLKVSEYGTIQKVPKWPQGLKKSQITQEMRDERDRIIAENAKVSEAFYEAMTVWDTKQEVAVRTQLQLPEDFDLDSVRTSYYEDSEWDITERAFI